MTNEYFSYSDDVHVSVCQVLKIVSSDALVGVRREDCAAITETPQALHPNPLPGVQEVSIQVLGVHQKQSTSRRTSAWKWLLHSLDSLMLDQVQPSVHFNTEFIFTDSAKCYKIFLRFCRPETQAVTQICWMFLICGPFSTVIKTRMCSSWWGRCYLWPGARCRGKQWNRCA